MAAPVKLHDLTIMASSVPGFHPEPESHSSMLLRTWLSGEWVKTIVVLSAGILFCFGGGQPLSAAPREKLIRVVLLNDAAQLKISVKGKFKILNAAESQVFFEGRRRGELVVLVTPAGLKAGSNDYPGGRLKFLPQRDAAVYINGRRFRGEIDIIKNSRNLLTAVNVIELDKYIKGVLYHEVSPQWPLESLKAQAVAARTYALYRMETNKDNDFDVTSDIYSQVYGGRNAERFRTNIAVDRTKGLVITYNGKILPAYYHATCAGQTEDASELWEEDLPPLKGVRCDYCLTSPHYSWRKNFRLKDIQDKLSTNGYPIGLIQDITAADRNPSGRIRNLGITARDGQTIKISGKDFRNIIGPNLIRSNNYKVVMHGYYMDLTGKGWGHGVGMCQWGANFMSRQDRKYDEILKYYYPGAEIVNYETAGL